MLVSKNESLIFVSAKNHLQSKIPGGVQVCTSEYLQLLQACNYRVITFPIDYTLSYIKRLKIKLGIEVYDRFNFKAEAEKLIETIKSHDAKYVALNQVNLMKLAPYIKKAFGDTIKIVILSHGNFSGDFLHEITREQKGWFEKVRDIIRLGFSVHQESYYFIRYIDVILCLSETEREINNWLGSPKNVFIPRTFTPDFLDWNPIAERLGFVGTLNHPPNIIGLEQLLKALDVKKQEGFKIRIVGKPEAIGMKLMKKYNFVEYVGYLNEEQLKEEASTWSIFLNPIFWYSRGATTKLAQAINWGIPIISTPAGNRGYFWKKGNILTANSPIEMAQLIVENLGTDSLSKLSDETKIVANNGPHYEDFVDDIKRAFSYP